MTPSAESTHAPGSPTVPAAREVAVIGAGIAGLTAAYRLRQAGCAVTVFETRDRVGGRIWTVRKGEFLMDLGTAVYLGTYREAIALIHELGLGSELVERPAIGAIPRQGSLHHLNYSKPLSTALRTGVLTPAAKLRALKLAMLVMRSRKSLGYDTYEELAAVDTETVRSYARRELSEELLQYAMRPLVSGTWVADDADTSIALCLWTIRNMLVPNVYNLTTGVAALPDELARRVETRLLHRVVNVTDTSDGAEITFVAGDGLPHTETFDACVIATTARPAIDIFPQMDANHRALYESTRYRRLGCVCVGLSRRPPDPATYVLVPPIEDPDTIAVVADHHKAPGRAPEGKGMLTVLLSHEYLERSEQLTDEQVLEHAIARAAPYHGDLTDAIEEHAVVRWPESVPTIDQGRFRRIAAFKRGLDPTARVQFASDLDRIPGVNGALVSGQEAAARIQTALAAENLPRTVARG
jgi:oxygen-dependent protoporphyrinogen oxidase